MILLTLRSLRLAHFISSSTASSLRPLRRRERILLRLTAMQRML